MAEDDSDVEDLDRQLLAWLATRDADIESRSSVLHEGIEEEDEEPEGPLAAREARSISVIIDAKVRTVV